MTLYHLIPSQIFSMTKRWKSLFSLEFLFLCFIIGVTFWGYYPILDDFFIMDDFDMIRGHSTFRQFLEHWTSPVGGGMYRPLIDVLFIWDFYWWGWNPLGWHLSNLLFHLFNSLLVYVLTKHLTKSPYSAMAAGVLFGLHTSHTEAVTWISARMDVVCATFFLLSVYYFIISKTLQAGKRQRAYLFSLVYFTCALFIKEMAVMLPCVLIAYDLTFLTDSKLNAHDVWKKARVFLPYFLLLLIYFVIRLSVLDGIGGHVPEWFGLFILENLVWYFKFLTIPFTEIVFSSSLLLNVSGISVLICLGLFFSKRSRFLILWILLTLVPVYMLNIGRGVYLASVGFCILLGMLLTFPITEQIFISQKKKLRAALRLCQFVLIMAVFLSYGAAIRKSNAWWSRIADINEQVPLKAKVLYPTLPEGARVCLQNVPIVVNQRFHHAFAFRYSDDELGGVYVKDFEKCAQNATRDEILTRYFFLYYHNEILYDVTPEVRERLSSEQPLIRRMPRGSASKLSKEYPRFTLELDAEAPCSSLAVVTSLANGITVPQGTVAAYGRIEGIDGTIEQFELVTGEDTAEWAIRFPRIRNMVQHLMPQNVYRAWTVQQSEEKISAAQNYIKRIPFRTCFIPVRLSLELNTLNSTSDDLRLDIDRILFYPIQQNRKNICQLSGKTKNQD